MKKHPLEICNTESCSEAAGRRLAEQQLSERERHYHDILHNLSDAIYLVEVVEDDNFRYLETNRAFEAMMGVAEDGMLGRYVGEVLRSSGAEASAENAIAKFRRCLETGNSISGEIALDTQNGQRILKSTLTPLLDESGRINRILGVSRDVTASKQAERLNDFLGYALDQANDAVFLIDPQACHRFRYVNDQACRSLNYSRDELLDMNVLDIDPVMDMEAARKVDTQLREQAFVRFETFHRRKDGQVFPVEISGTVIEYGGQTLSLAIVRDITVRKRLEQERQSHLHFFESMDRVNRAIQGSNNLETVLNEVLDCVLAIFDADRAFLCHPCDPEADSWSVPFEKTKPEFPGALALGTVMPMDADVAETFRLLLDAKGPVTQGAGNQYRLPNQVSEQFGFKSQISMVFYPKGDKAWHFGLQQCSGTRVWTADEQKLFQEIGRRLADALTSLLAYCDIQQREQKFQALADSMPDIVAAYDLQLLKTYANRNLERYLATDIGVPWLDKTPKELYPDGELDEYQAKLEELRNTGTCDDLIWEKSCKGGGTFIYQTRFAALRDPGGKIIGELTITRDVTKSRQLELELIRNERKFSSLVKNSPGFIGRFDTQLRRTYVNQAYQDATKTSEEEVLGKTPLDYWRFVSPNAEEFCTILRRVMATRLQERIEAHAVTATGTVRYFSMHMVPELDENGDIDGVLTTGIEITDMKNAERLKVEAREDERKMLARELHDDLGQRLTALRLDIALLELKFGKNDSELLAKIKEMDAAVGETVKIVRSLLNMLRPAVLDLGLVPALEWLAAEFRKRTGAKCDLRLPEHAIRFDESQTMAIFRIVQESLTNVMKYAKARKVSIALTGEDDGYRLEIEDDGKGFELGASRKNGSFGLQGIAERVQMLGGKFDIVSSPDHGTKLKVQLPITRKT